MLYFLQIVVGEGQMIAGLPGIPGEREESPGSAEQDGS